MAIYNNFIDKNVPFKEFIKLIDIKKHMLNTRNKSFINNYEEIRIFTTLNYKYLYECIDDNKLNRIKKWINFITLK